jgi:hypothetical protein
MNDTISIFTGVHLLVYRTDLKKNSHVHYQQQNRQRSCDKSAAFHKLDRTFHKWPHHIQIIFFSSAALRSKTDIYSYFLHSFMSTDTLTFGYGSRLTVTTALDNNLILKWAFAFPLLFILIAVPDDGFKLHTEICRTLYTLEVLPNSYLFIYDTRTHSEVTYLKILPDTFSDFFPNSYRYSN